MARYWGYHLILDCSGCDIKAITDPECHKQFLKDLVEKIDMVAYGDPIIEHFAKHDPEKAGYTIVQLIETSSITGHFVDATGEAYLDIFSCKEYDDAIVRELVDVFYAPTLIKSNFFTRQAYRH